MLAFCFDGIRRTPTAFLELRFAGPAACHGGLMGTLAPANPAWGARNSQVTVTGVTETVRSIPRLMAFVNSVHYHGNSNALKLRSIRCSTTPVNRMH